MKKLEDLRQHLLSNVPSLKRNPERLLTFIEDGRIEFWPGQNLSHSYTMPIRLIVTDYAGSVDDIIVPVLSWLTVREPGSEPNNTLSFEAELLNNNSYDIGVSITITERVIVNATEAGLVIEHVLPEPALQMDPDAQWDIIMDMHGLKEPVGYDN